MEKMNIVLFKKNINRIMEKVNKTAYWPHCTIVQTFGLLDAIEKLGVKEISTTSIFNNFDAFTYIKLINGECKELNLDNFIIIDNKKLDCSKLPLENKEELINIIKNYPFFDKNNINNNGRLIITQDFINYLNFNMLNIKSLINGLTEEGDFLVVF